MSLPDSGDSRVGGASTSSDPSSLSALCVVCGERFIWLGEAQEFVPFPTPTGAGMWCPRCRLDHSYGADDSIWDAVEVPHPPSG